MWVFAIHNSSPFLNKEQLTGEKEMGKSRFSPQIILRPNNTEMSAHRIPFDETIYHSGEHVIIFYFQ